MMNCKQADAALQKMLRRDALEIADIAAHPQALFGLHGEQITDFYNDMELKEFGWVVQSWPSVNTCTIVVTRKVGKEDWLTQVASFQFKKGNLVQTALDLIEGNKGKFKTLGEFCGKNDSRHKALIDFSGCFMGAYCCDVLIPRDEHDKISAMFMRYGFPNLVRKHG